MRIPLFEPPADEGGNCPPSNPPRDMLDLLSHKRIFLVSGQRICINLEVVF